MRQVIDPERSTFPYDLFTFTQSMSQRLYLLNVCRPSERALLYLLLQIKDRMPNCAFTDHELVVAEGDNYNSVKNVVPVQSVISKDAKQHYRIEFEKHQKSPESGVYVHFSFKLNLSLAEVNQDVKTSEEKHLQSFPGRKSIRTAGRLSVTTKQEGVKKEDTLEAHEMLQRLRDIECVPSDVGSEVRLFDVWKRLNQDLDYQV